MRLFFVHKSVNINILRKRTLWRYFQITLKKLFFAHKSENINISRISMFFEIALEKLSVYLKISTFWEEGRFLRSFLKTHRHIDAHRSENINIWTRSFWNNRFCPYLCKYQQFGVKHVFQIMLKNTFYIHKSTNINIWWKRTFFWDHFGIFCLIIPSS